MQAGVVASGPTAHARRQRVSRDRPPAAPGRRRGRRGGGPL